jgi:hypothetical protein
MVFSGILLLKPGVDEPDVVPAGGAGWLLQPVVVMRAKIVPQPSARSVSLVLFIVLIPLVVSIAPVR